MEDVINPAVPATTGALLAEEWTINPLATLPSFLEMFMIDEANRSARKSLDACMGIVAQKFAIQARAAQARASRPGRLPPTTTSTFSELISLIQKSFANVASKLALLMERFGPEISFLILYALERRCLRSEACATISESLYGGRQAKLDSSSKQNEQRKLLPLTDADKTRSALLVAFYPYIRQRLLRWYQKLKRQYSSNAVSEGRLSRLRKLQNIFVWVYPMLHLSMSGLDLFYQWRYMLGYSVFFHPSSHLLGLIVRRVTLEDTLQSQQTMEKAAPTQKNSDPSAGSSALRNLAVWGLSSAVILSWVSHFRAEFRRQRQELLIQQQQQQQQQNGQTAQNATLPQIQATPPPPSNAIRNALPAHLCPLCRQPRVNPTASSSGFVFCYKCLLNHVKETGSCPVTGRTCKEAQLLRLYEPNSATTTTTQL